MLAAYHLNGSLHDNTFSLHIFALYDILLQSSKVLLFLVAILFCDRMLLL